ncbi:hypothetical protein GALMADRAFT_76112 [Galerina marginata CBS 339.88]|uniref:Hydrophobin n=1 Tax=Galerina marginata (strain CBS 339.88) TaxID=685588 RepID=A0A067SKD2_GALM3|nr:hypothetical protein GALMADRAFT_76112 [Galerina marginata CBS 339.88]
MLFKSASLLVPLVAALNVQAICGGFNFGIGNVRSLGGGVNRWDVFDDGCNVVDGLTTNQNPCSEGIFGCSPPPIIFNQYTNTFTHLRYACRTDPSSGRCGNTVVSVCCRNDGN